MSFDQTAPFSWIDNSAQLRQVCDQLQSSPAVAIDTEFVRTDTFYPKPALFQVANETNAFLIDPLAIDDLTPLKNLSTDPDVIKVFHSCSEDLEVFKLSLGCVPTPLMDTQIAAAMAHIGGNGNIGYAGLVKELLDIELPKGETRSDWLQRPLSNKQCHYAVQDVLYLLPMYRQLSTRLEELGRTHWLLEECRNLEQAALAPEDPDAYYPRIKQAWKLSRSELALLRVLSAWREREARRVDRPRNHVVPERVLWELANQAPETLEDIKALPDWRRRQFNTYGETLLELIASYQETDLPPPLSGPLPPEQRRLVKTLKNTVAEVASQLDVPAELLARKSDYEDLVRSGMNGGRHQLSERLSGWRQAVVGDKLLAIVERHAQSQQKDGQ